MTTKKRLAGDTLIIGGNGLLGGALRRHWNSQGRDIVATDRQSLDLAGDLAHWNPPVPPSAGGVAILCAAVTGQKESRVSTSARFINVDQTIALGRRLADSGYFLVFLSTSLVFDGTDRIPPTTRPPTPVTAYGRNKADAERGLSALTGDLAIVRLTKVLHENLAILAAWRLAMSEGEAIHPFSNYLCAPISLTFAVSVLCAIAESRAAGIWHLSSSDEVSYGDLARSFAEREGFRDSLVRPIEAPAGMMEHLPLHAALDASLTESTLGFKTPLARAALEGEKICKT